MSSLDDKVAAKRQSNGAKAPASKAKATTPKAPAKATATPAKAAPKAAAKAAPKVEAKPDPKVVEPVVPTPAEIDAALVASVPLFAPVQATRETKIAQVQYDGKTPEGYTVRIWAPPGSPMVTGVLLTTP